MDDNGNFYFESLNQREQEIIIELIVSIIEEKTKNNKDNKEL